MPSQPSGKSSNFQNFSDSPLKIKMKPYKKIPVASCNIQHSSKVRVPWITVWPITERWWDCPGTAGALSDTTSKTNQKVWDKQTRYKRKALASEYSRGGRTEGDALTKGWWRKREAAAAVPQTTRTDSTVTPGRSQAAEDASEVHTTHLHFCICQINLIIWYLSALSTQALYNFDFPSHGLRTRLRLHCTAKPFRIQLPSRDADG